MVKILREVKGSYENKPPNRIRVIDKPAGFLSRAKYKWITDPENPDPNYDVSFRYKNEDYSAEFKTTEWKLFSNGKFRILTTNPLTNKHEFYVFMYKSKFYLSEIYLSNEDFMTVLQKEVLSKKDKYIEALEKIKTEEVSKEYSREPIPQDVQIFVWKRDEGKCVKCGSNENLEYDHIIPVSKGGNNTARNIQLLCQTCNRSKSNKIGGQSLPSTSNITESNQEVIFDEIELPIEGSWESVYEEAKAYYWGRGEIEEDFEEAFKLFNQAAKLGCIQAYWILGKMLVEGEGVKKDKERALLTFKEGINHGDYRCWAELARLYCNKGEFNELRTCWAQYFNSEHFKDNITYEDKRRLETQHQPSPFHVMNSNAVFAAQYLRDIYIIENIMNINQEIEFMQYLYPLREELIDVFTIVIKVNEEDPSLANEDTVDMFKKILTDIRNWE